MPEKQKSTTGAQATEQQERGLLDQIVEQGKLGKDPAARERIRADIDRVLTRWEHP